MAGFELPTSGRFYPTHNDARYLGEVVVYYPLHPFFGRGKLPVCRRRGTGHAEHVEVQIDGVRQALPLWMTDERFCNRLTMGFEPVCALTALLELILLVHSTEL